MYRQDQILRKALSFCVSCRCFPITQGQDKLQREREKDSSRFLTSIRVRNKKTAESSGLKMKKKTSDNRPPVSKKTLLVSNEVDSSESRK